MPVDNRKIFTISHPTLGFVMENTDGAKAFTKHLYRAKFFPNETSVSEYIFSFHNPDTRKLLSIRPLSLEY